MTSVIEQREKFFVQPAERSDAEDNVKENKGRRSKRANQQNLVRDKWEENLAYHAEQHEERADATGERKIVKALLSVPLHRGVFEAHGVFDLVLLDDERFRRGYNFMLGQAVEHEPASFAAHIRRNGERCAIRQSAEQASVVRQTLARGVFARSPIDEDIRLYQVAKPQIHRHSVDGIPAQARDDAAPWPKVRFGPDHRAELRRFALKFRPN